MRRRLATLLLTSRKGLEGTNSKLGVESWLYSDYAVGLGDCACYVTKDVSFTFVLDESRQLSLLFLIGYCPILVDVCGAKRELAFLPLQAHSPYTNSPL